MIVVRRLEGETSFSTRPLVTLGNFDGLHLGHCSIIQELKKRADIAKAQTVVVTFDPHPRQVLNPSSPLQLITSLEHRLKIFEALDVDVVWVIPFDREFSKLSAESFVQDLLFPRLKFSELIVGTNYAFGKERKGNMALLEDLGLRLGFKVDTMKAVHVDGELVSSSLIRRCIAQGDLRKASLFLGRPYSLMGRVVHGRGIGSALGFATANLEFDSLVLPPRGVYAVEVKMGLEKHFGIANLGVRPTFEGGDTLEYFEVHLINFSGSIYGKHMEVILIEKVRDEIRFESVEALSRQVKKDIECVREKFLSI